MPAIILLNTIRNHFPESFRFAAQSSGFSPLINISSQKRPAKM